MNTETPYLPWQQTLWQQFLAAWQQNRLPHALLFAGPRGMGKISFAQQWVRTLLCEQPLAEGQACGHCHSCRLLLSHNHPDFALLEPAEQGKQIQVEHIRSLIQFCSLTTYSGRYRIAIITPAEAMNLNAANSLLKLLEEPPPKTILILISHRHTTLLATIRSRCQRLDFSRPDHTVVKSWLDNQLNNKEDSSLLLQLTSYAPLAALELAKNEGLAKRRGVLDSFSSLLKGHDPVHIAEGWSKLEITQVLSWMLSWTMDLIRYRSSGQTHHLVNQDYQAILQQMAIRFDLPGLFTLLDLQKEAYRLATATSNVNPRGLLETLAIVWVQHTTNKKKIRL